MTRDEEDMMLSLIDSSADEDISKSEHFASIAKMKKTFVRMYRAKSDECDQKDITICEQRQKIKELEAKTLPQQIVNNFNGSVSQVVGTMQQQKLLIPTNNEQP